MLIHAAWFLAGLALLVKGSDVFVEAASRLAKKLGISDFVIGLTIVAVGTSMPELAAAITASFQGDSGLVIGNIVGSNIANIGLVLGITTLFARRQALSVRLRVLNLDGYIMMAVTGLFYVLVFDGALSLIEGAFFLVIYTVYILFLSRTMKKGTYEIRDFVRYFLRFDYMLTIRDHMLRKTPAGKPRYRRKIWDAFKAGVLVDALICALGGAAVIYGAHLLVSNALWFANVFNIPSNVIGLTIIAVGTSLPELGISIAAARKGFSDIVFGNILGSNIANILLILGISALISPVSVISLTLRLTGPTMLMISALLLWFMRKGRITRADGMVLLASYAAFMAALYAFLA